MGLTGKSYDIKASLMDYSARWYSPSAGRFTTQDTWAGNPASPQTLNRYAYAMNNPVNITRRVISRAMMTVTETSVAAIALTPVRGALIIPTVGAVAEAMVMVVTHLVVVATVVTVAARSVEMEAEEV